MAGRLTYHPSAIQRRSGTADVRSDVKLFLFYCVIIIAEMGDKCAIPGFDLRYPAGAGAFIRSAFRMR